MHITFTPKYSHKRTKRYKNTLSMILENLHTPLYKASIITNYTGDICNKHFSSATNSQIMT